MSVDRPLRVLHLTAASAEGGVSRYLFDLARHMRRQGHEITLVGRRGAWHDLFESEGLRWLELPLDGGAGELWRSYHALSRHLREHPQDVLHSHYRKSMCLAHILGRHRGIATLSTLHLTDIPMSPLHRFASCFGRHVHAPSLKAQRWLIEVARVPASRVTVIPHGVDVEHFAFADAQQQADARAALSLAAGATIAAFVGRFEPQKNPQWMIDLADAARARAQPMVVLLMGGGSLEAALREQVRARGLGDQVRLLPYGDPRRVYQACDGVLLPSGYEGFALTAVEAMSMGRPVLRTDTAGADEQIPDETIGRVVPIGRDQFVTESLRFLSDRAALSRMGLAASRHVREHLTLARQIEQTVALYRRVASCGA